MARLSVRTPSQPERIETLQADTVTIGRGRQCDLAIKDPHLSRAHCRLEREGAGFLIRDLGSRNGVKVNDKRIQGTRSLATGDLIRIGQTRLLYVADSSEDAEDEAVDAGQTIMLDQVTQDMEAGVDGQPSQKPLRFVLQYKKGKRRRFLPLTKEQLTIGRHRSCGLILRDNSVSSCHAAIEFRNGQYMIHDLGSTNGVKVNGQKVEKAVLSPGTRIRLGNVALGFKEVVSRGPTVKTDAVEESEASTPPSASPAVPPSDKAPQAGPAAPPAEEPDLPLEEPEAFDEEDVEETIDDSDGPPQWTGSGAETNEPAPSADRGAPTPPPARDIPSAPAPPPGPEPRSDPPPPQDSAADATTRPEASSPPAESPPGWLPGAPHHMAIEQPQWVEVKFESDPHLPKPVLPDEPCAAPQALTAPTTLPVEPDRRAADGEAEITPAAAGTSASATGGDAAPPAPPVAPPASPADEAPETVSPETEAPEDDIKQVMSDLDRELEGFTPVPGETPAPVPPPAEPPGGPSQQTTQAPAESAAARTPQEPGRGEPAPAQASAVDTATAKERPAATASDTGSRERRLLIRLVALVALILGLLLIFFVPWRRIFGSPAQQGESPSRPAPSQTEVAPGSRGGETKPLTPPPRMTADEVETPASNEDGSEAVF